MEKKLISKLFFLCSFRMKTCLAFYFPAVEFFFKAQNWSKNPEMAKLEFENHGFLQNNIFLATEQAGTNIC